MAQSKSHAVAAAILERLKAESDLNLDANPISQEDLFRLEEACGGDFKRLKRYLRRRLVGEPTAYILGFMEFRGRRFKMDRRAFITDPETTHLVEAVIRHVRKYHGGERVLVAEVGSGCGSLAISLKGAVPTVDVVAVEIDSQAIELARENAAEQDVDIVFVESDLFDSWPGAAPPEVIFGDPPWGDHTTLYDAARGARHYLAMPPISAFPIGHRTQAHRQILEDVRRRKWTSHLFLNCGSLPRAEIEALAPSGFSWEVQCPARGLGILHGHFAGAFTQDGKPG